MEGAGVGMGSIDQINKVANKAQPEKPKVAQATEEEEEELAAMMAL